MNPNSFVINKVLHKSGTKRGRRGKSKGRVAAHPSLASNRGRLRTGKK